LPNWLARHFFGSQCPSCKQRGYLAETSTRRVSRKTIYKTVERVKTIRDGEGAILTTESWDERVPVMRNTYRIYEVCKKCGGECYHLRIQDED